MKLLLLSVVVVLGVASAACGHPVERDARASTPPPSVTVAEPIVTSLSEWTEDTGRSEAVETVEVRARVSGHLQRVGFQEGDLVRKGDLLFVVDPRPYEAALARANAEVNRAHADQELARLEAGRAERLFKTNVIAERDWDQQRLSLVQLEARSQSALAAVTSANLDVEYAYVRAPISGRIGRVLVTPGNLVGPELPTPLATIVSVDPLYVSIDIDEARGLRLIRVPASQRIAHVGFVDEPGYPHDAEVDFLDNRVDPQTGTLRVRLVVRNPDGQLRPGTFARVRLQEGGPHDVLLVSDRAIATDQDRRFVWVVDGEGKVDRRVLTLGPLQDGMRVVRGGLKKGEHVVIRGLQRVRPGAVVTPEVAEMTAMMQGTPSGGAK